ncbi:carbohydrate ABC transporter permease [Gracilinema caldarium]|uniref:ABC-type transporter, integral membrane subunit n=1 Tax=Gracilinema caldarium (strain ATCC 51460 / DSM 7334 / H1) TaxID=744872 RepID=F8F372_GRAC1|nr:sugar ABC transporter permease [Gracilinema caldarium]AEJ20398.1 ABC-type transporter, integral membrane subunit [Gracilinema caldarium DSM 7334]
MIQQRTNTAFRWIIYLIPALVIYTTFMAFPLFDSVRLSFFRSGSYLSRDFVGFDNYLRLLLDKENALRFWSAFGNTWYFFFIHMAVQNILGILFAVLLMEKGLKGAGIYRTIIFIPATLAVLVTGYLWKLILNPQWGALTIFLKIIGMEHLSRPWLGETRYALTTVSLVSAWQWVGMPTMMFLAGLQNISDDMYEAADIAGASKLQTFWYITLPLLKPVIGIVTILTFVGNFNAFDVVFAMENVNGAPLYSTDIMGTLFYRVGIAGQHPVSIPDPGMGSAIATTTFIMLAIGSALVLKTTSDSSEKKVLR